MSSNAIHKAAILLLSLPHKQAAQLLARLDPKHVEAVSVEMAGLGSVAGDEQKQVIHEFAQTRLDDPAGCSGGLDLVQGLLKEALGRHAAGTLHSVRRSLESLPFGFLEQVHPDDLLGFIAEEHPQTIALILSYVSPSQAAAILSGLPGEQQSAVICRIARMGHASQQAVHDVETELERRMAPVIAGRVEPASGIARVAEILAAIDADPQRELLDNLADDDPDLAAEIRRTMLECEEISR
jgi:flagellar motor switch protein FliG